MNGHIDQQNMVHFLPKPAEMSGDEKVNIHGCDFPDQALVQEAPNFADAGIKSPVLYDRMNEVIFFRKIDQTPGVIEICRERFLLEHVQSVDQRFLINFGMCRRNGTVEKHLRPDLADRLIQIGKERTLQLEFRRAQTREFRI